MHNMKQTKVRIVAMKQLLLGLYSVGLPIYYGMTSLYCILILYLYILRRINYAYRLVLPLICFTSLMVFMREQ